MNDLRFCLSRLSLATKTYLDYAESPREQVCLYTHAMSARELLLPVQGCTMGQTDTKGSAASAAVGLRKARSSGISPATGECLR